MALDLYLHMNRKKNVWGTFSLSSVFLHAEKMQKDISNE